MSGTNAISNVVSTRPATQLLFSGAGRPFTAIGSWASGLGNPSNVGLVVGPAAAPPAALDDFTDTQENLIINGDQVQLTVPAAGGYQFNVTFTDLECPGTPGDDIYVALFNTTAGSSAPLFAVKGPYDLGT